MLVFVLVMKSVFKLLVVNINFFSDPCEKVKCKNHGVCVRDRNMIRGYRCKCKKCSSFENTVFPVCGTDRRTYRNECHLKRRSCRRNRHVTIAYKGSCGMVILCFILLSVKFVICIDTLIEQAIILCQYFICISSLLFKLLSVFMHKK